jgi:hypothetical protein
MNWGQLFIPIPQLLITASMWQEMMAGFIVSVKNRKLII